MAEVDPGPFRVTYCLYYYEPSMKRWVQSCHYRGEERLEEATDHLLTLQKGERQWKMLKHEQRWTRVG